MKRALKNKLQTDTNYEIFERGFNTMKYEVSRRSKFQQANVSRFSDRTYLQLPARLNDFKIKNIFLAIKFTLIAIKPIEGGG
jgi:hypothetical protein